MSKKDKIRASAVRRTLEIIRPHAGGQKWIALGGLIALLGDVAFRVLEPWPMKYAIDLVSSSLGARLADGAQIFGIDLGRNSAIALGSLALTLAIIVGARALCNYAATVCFALAGSRVATLLRSRVFNHIQQLSLKYHSRASVGDTSQRLVGDVGRLQEVAVTAGLPLVGNVITLLVLLVVVVILDPLLSAVVVVAAAAFLVISRFSGPKITGAARTTRKGEGKLVHSAAEALGAMRVVQAYGLEQTVAADFADGNARALKAGVRSKRLAAALERSTDLLVGVASALVLVLGGWRVLSGAMTPGDMVLFIMYLKIAMKPLRDMAKYTGRIARATASGERIAELLDEPIDIADAPGAITMGRAQGDLDFVGLGSRDGYGRSLFTDLNLHIPAGQRVGLLGPSGAGKSTLAGYLLRLSDPETGRVLVDGLDTREVTRAGLRANVSILLQESVLFAVSIRENIRYGRLDASAGQIAYACRRAGIHDFIESLPEGYDTVLGGRGDTLSGGQRQRIALARAMVRQAPIVILDEATTGLDPESREAIVGSLDELTTGRTTLAITHDVAMLRGLDRLIWLEDGRIVEDGAPAELLTRPGGRVARWAGLQTQGRA
ncbi:ABC transporter ATP-binding protein/permease [Brevibacterium sp. 91QC2O2]|uniref:ABC transporter ATP-binding protein n=1 Tax=Brevibacterium sp. 91QC2O2 TaxID=2968458 RepID=UPI00211C72A7|nr:ABC transporter ATP-binding protein [Brevibacterium sp. 91QC2O2]MCQ9366745.1 ABC transporter ATP-binding protein/permease [Brevibacterium sp. 91QC2O2]